MNTFNLITRRARQSHADGRVCVLCLAIVLVFTCLAVALALPAVS